MLIVNDTLKHILEHVKDALVIFAVISLIFLTGYYRGYRDADNKSKAETIKQATKNANIIAELQAENAKRLTKIDTERNSLADRVRKLSNRDCTHFNSDFGMLYNETATGTKSAPIKAPIDFYSATHTILKNDLTCRALHSEYTKCYKWAEGFR